MAKSVSKKSVGLNNMVSAKQAMLVFHILIQGVLLSYLMNLEKKDCKCSEMDNLREIIKYMTIVVMVFSMVKLFLLDPEQSTMTLGLLNLINMGLVVYFLFKLMKMKNCECAESWQRLVVFAVYAFIMGVYTLLLSVPILLFSLPLAILALPFIIMLVIVKYLSK
jgi:hypothetical protein